MSNTRTFTTGPIIRPRISQEALPPKRPGAHLDLQTGTSRAPAQGRRSPRCHAHAVSTGKHPGSVPKQLFTGSRRLASYQVPFLTTGTRNQSPVAAGRRADSQTRSCNNTLLKNPGGKEEIKGKPRNIWRQAPVETAHTKRAGFRRNPSKRNVSSRQRPP